MGKITDKERIEEGLSLIWTLEEEGHREEELFRKLSDDDETDQIIRTLIEDGLANVAAGEILLTDNGRKIAKGLIRRQRLAERLFSDVFEMPDDSVLDDACKMEHILSEGLTESVCIFLGHPPSCPHGKPIPRGECCAKFKVDVAPVVTRLSEFIVGAAGRITFIVPSDSSRIQRLNSLGITAGSVIKLLQKTPSFVIQIDETTVAIDPEIAKEIYIKKVS